MHKGLTKSKFCDPLFTYTFGVAEETIITGETSCVVLGFRNPDCKYRPTFAPSLTRATRQFYVGDAGLTNLGRQQEV